MGVLARRVLFAGLIFVTLGHQGGDCCKAKNTFELCSGDLANTTALTCTNATAKLADGLISVDLPKSMISGLTVQATSVRYAYANFPQCALYNKHGLPAAPFVAEIEAAPAAAVDGVDFHSAGGAGLAKTPPMGVNTWNSFHCNVDERKMRAMADALVTSGLSKAG